MRGRSSGPARAWCVRSLRTLPALDPVQARMLLPREGEPSIFGAHARSSWGRSWRPPSAIRVGDAVSLTSFAPGTGGRPSPAKVTPFASPGIFHTGYYDFDLGLVFMSLSTADELYGGGASPPADVRGKDRQQVPRRPASGRRLPRFFRAAGTGWRAGARTTGRSSTRCSWRS